MVRNLPGGLRMVQKQILTENVHNIIKSYRQDLAKAGISYRQLIVFGSHSKGNPKPWSDIDLCVVAQEFGADPHGSLVRLLKIRSEASLDIEPHPFTPEDLDDPWNPLAAEVRRYGISV